MKLAYGLLGILAFVPFVSPLPARAEEAPEATPAEQTEVATTLTEGAGVPALSTTPQPPPSKGGGESEPPLADPCLMCPVPVVAAASAGLETPPSLAPAPSTPVAPVAPPAPATVPATIPTVSTVNGSTGTSAPTAAPTQKPTSYPSKSVLINEFVSDPADGVEWIEIVNTTEEEIDLTGWAVKDATTSKTVLPAQSLPGLSYFVVQNPKGKLNNDGDSIFLFDATGATIDAISYDKTTAPKKGTSLARTSDGTWKSADPTPLALNTWPDASPAPIAAETVSPDTTTYATTNNPSAALSDTQSNTSPSQGTDTPAGTPSPVRVELDPQVETSITAAGTQLVPPPDPLHFVEEEQASQSRPAIPVIDASEITNYAANATVTVEGVLVAGPGTFGKQLAYIDGLEIYFNKADWPKLSPMTRVRMTGTVDVKTDYTRLKIKKRADIKVIGDDSVAPSSLETLDDAAHGLLMSITGSVVDVNGKIVTVDLENGEMINITSAKDASVDFSELAYCDRVAMSGVTRLTKGTWTITLLNQTGLTTLTSGAEVAALSTTPQPPPSPGGGESEPIRPPSSTIKSPTKSAPWVGGGLLTTSIGALGYWFAKAKGITLPSLS